MAKLGLCWFPDGSLLGPSRVLKARPARRAFVFLGRLLLGGSPPLFDQLQQRLAAAWQAVAFLKLVEQGNDFAWQRDNELMISLGRKPAAICAVSVDDWLGRGFHASPTCG